MKSSKVPMLSIAIAALMALPVTNTLAKSSKAKQVVYKNDFEKTVGREWSLPITDTTPKGGRRFLGQFCNDTVQLTLENLPPHSKVTVSFDLFIIRKWDGNYRRYGPDYWDLSILTVRSYCIRPLAIVKTPKHIRIYTQMAIILPTRERTRSIPLVTSGGVSQQTQSTN